MKDVVILIPVYDPNEKIMQEFLEKLEKKFKNIVFIDDGCSQKYQKYLESLKEKYPVLKHHINLGKGRGIKNGLNYILNNYPKVKAIVTADCDGQHSPKDIQKVAEMTMNNENSLILGVRDFNNTSVPFKSRYGNILTKNIMYNLLGMKISDTQTGLRGMSPSVAQKLLEVEGEKYEYETNVLINCEEKNTPIKEVVIDTIYIDDNATSHFNPVQDSYRIYKLFTKYLLVVLLAYLIETITFSFFLSSKINIIVSSLLIIKIASFLFVKLVNKFASIYIYLVSTFLTFLCIVFLPSNLILIFKILLDIILVVICLLINNNQNG